MKIQIICLKIVLFCFLICISTTTFHCEAGVKAVVYANNLSNMNENSFQRILNAKGVVYILTQQTVGMPVSVKTRERYKKLKEDGKKVILDIWWGPNGEYNWNKYDFPDIAQNPQSRSEFFKKVIDPTINEIGKKNLYGVEMLEETGGWYGYKKTVWPNMEFPTVNTPNIRKYNWLLQKETGLNMDMSPIWNMDENFACWRWINRTLSPAAAQKVFYDYIHKKYHGLKVFQFEGLPDVATRCYGEYQVMLNSFDGIITDAYDSPREIYSALISYRTMAPKTEIVALVNGYFGTYGTKEDVYKIKKKRLKYALSAGMNGIGFFEPDGKKVKVSDFQDPAVWRDNLKLFKIIVDKSVNVKKRKMLLVPLNYSVGGYGLAWYFGSVKLTGYAMIPASEFRMVNPADYRAIVILGGYYPGVNTTWNQDYMQKKYHVDALFDANKLNRFVENGGLLVITGLPMNTGAELALVQKKLLTGSSLSTVKKLTLNNWSIQNLKMKPAYSNGFSRNVYQYKTGPSVISLGENCGYIVKYGKGYFLVLPQQPTGGSSKEAKSYAAFLTDVLRGFFNYAGARELAEYFN
ncbi:MAG: hypothetical protein M1135_02215 [Candidatus Omnitrophica bacterium]|nr:hypothetical protein [Candidatus Omnitrophota bacterium]